MFLRKVTPALLLPVLLGLSAASLLGAGAALDTASIETITGLKGTYSASEGVFKVTAPRKDVPVTVDGWKLSPFMGLTSWAAFKSGGKAEGMVMGDLVLFEDEVNPVMSAALTHGLEVTALHNHFFFDQPHVFFMHIGGEGSVAELAAGVHAALDMVTQIRIKDPDHANKFPGPEMPKESAIAAAPLEALLGAKGQANAGMVKFVFGREATMECGCPVGKEMGVNTWAVFAGTDDNAIVDGDFAATESELQTVLKSLRASGINIVAIHQHMIGETPRFVFLHYWGRGPAADLAKAIKTTLVTQGIK